MILGRYSRVAATEGKICNPRECWPISTMKVPLGERGSGELSGNFRKEDWKVIAAVHVVKMRPREVKKEQRGTGEIK